MVAEAVGRPASGFPVAISALDLSATLLAKRRQTTQRPSKAVAGLDYRDVLRTRFAEDPCKIVTSGEQPKGQVKGVFWVFLLGQRTEPKRIHNPLVTGSSLATPQPLQSDYMRAYATDRGAARIGGVRKVKGDTGGVVSITPSRVHYARECDERGSWPGSPSGSIVRATTLGESRSRPRSVTQ